MLHRLEKTIARPYSIYGCRAKYCIVLISSKRERHNAKHIITEALFNTLRTACTTGGSNMNVLSGGVYHRWFTKKCFIWRRVPPVAHNVHNVFNCNFIDFLKKFLRAVWCRKVVIWTGHRFRLIFIFSLFFKKKNMGPSNMGNPVFVINTNFLLKKFWAYF